MRNSPRRPVLSNADIAAILAELQTRVSGSSSLRAWTEDTSITTDRVVATSDLNYVRLAERDHEGSPIVLMLLDGTWERAV